MNRTTFTKAVASVTITALVLGACMTADMGGGELTRNGKADDSPGKRKLGLALRPLLPGETRRRCGRLAHRGCRRPGRPGRCADWRRADGRERHTGPEHRQVRQVVAKSAKSIALLLQRDGNKIFVPLCVGRPTRGTKDVPRAPHGAAPSLQPGEIT